MQVIPCLWIGLNLSSYTLRFWKGEVGWPLIWGFSLFGLIGIWRLHLLVAAELVCFLGGEGPNSMFNTKANSLSNFFHRHRCEIRHQKFQAFSEILVTLYIFWDEEEFKPCISKTGANSAFVQQEKECSQFYFLFPKNS